MTTAPKIKKSEPSNGASGSGVEPGSTTNDHQPRPRSEEPYESLRRPFTAEAVRFKVQSKLTSGALVVAYIDARLVIERLNLVVPGQWSERYERVQDGLLCRLTVGNVTHEDVGDGKGKAAYSDAFKRAAVKHGIGVSIYAIPQVRVTNEKHLRKSGNTVALTDEGLTALRKGYSKWLEQTGTKMFGEPIDHGDVAESQGDPEADAEPVPVEAELDYQPPKPATGKAVDELCTEIEVVYDHVREANPTFLLPAVFKREYEMAKGSEDDLALYRDLMYERLNEVRP
jgi:hypothetical protein